MILLVLATIGAPIAAALTGHGVNQQFFNGLNINGIPLPPLSHEIGNNGQPNPHGAFFVLGTDRLGRDMLVRILYGARTTLAVGIGATGVALFVGLVLGMTAGYFGGRSTHLSPEGSRLRWRSPRCCSRSDSRRSSARG